MALASILNVNESTISRWMNDGPMSVENAISICTYLDISLDWFLTGNGAADQHRRTVAGLAAENGDLMQAFERVVRWMTAPTKAHLLELLNSIPDR